MSDRVSITTSDHIARVTLTRPDKINALDSAMFDAIISAIAELAVQPDLRAVVVSGEGRGFCAGLDMASLQGDSAPTKLLERTHGVANRFQQVAWGWRTLPMPVIAAAHGIAIGGGLNILSGADIRIVHPDTRCSVMEMRWGLVPDMAGYPLWRGNVRDDVLRKLVYTNAESQSGHQQSTSHATHGHVGNGPAAATLRCHHRRYGGRTVWTSRR
ncbi:enoyl-CoA hydratase/isomerase family protein [Luminiphilus sp.]|nr:enoyl-CoA hydratase/isomerase family protein [Luminiphilus sp.]